MSFVGAATNEAGRQVARNLLGQGQQPKPDQTREEAEQQLTRAENWRMVSAPVSFGVGWLGVSAVLGAPVAAPAAAVVFVGLAVGSWLERRRARARRHVEGGALG